MTLKIGLGHTKDVLHFCIRGTPTAGIVLRMPRDTPEMFSSRDTVLRMSPELYNISISTAVAAKTINTVSEVANPGTAR